LRETIPSGFQEVGHILCEIDVVWVAKGRNSIESLFEVEHSTSIYSGLLRFNDLLLTDPSLSHFSIVSDDSRRSVFARQLFRPTFQRSGLAELASFLEYANVFDWHSRLLQSGPRSQEMNLAP
jgi:type II restriction enzyme